VPPTLIANSADSEDQANAAIVLFLIPYVAAVCEESLLEHLKAKFSVGIQIVFDHFHESAPLEKFKELIQTLIGPITPGTVHPILGQVIRAYSTFAKGCPVFALLICTVCTVFLGMAIQSQSFIGIAKTAQYDKMPGNSSAACNFLQLCQRAPGSTGSH
jgi:hypothetical protein